MQFNSVHLPVLMSECIVLSLKQLSGVLVQELLQ